MTKLITAVIAYLTFLGTAFADGVTIYCTQEQSELTHRFLLKEGTKEIFTTDTYGTFNRKRNVLYWHDDVIFFSRFTKGEDILSSDVYLLDRITGILTVAGVTRWRKDGSRDLTSTSEYTCDVLLYEKKKF